MADRYTVKTEVRDGVTYYRVWDSRKSEWAFGSPKDAKRKAEARNRARDMNAEWERLQQGGK